MRCLKRTDAAISHGRALASCQDVPMTTAFAVLGTGTTGTTVTAFPPDAVAGSGADNTAAYFASFEEK
jgi:hypothetical protein